ncbi:hypothetical protein HaLaN_12712, partial [Haematococcus lacustris]
MEGVVRSMRDALPDLNSPQLQHCSLRLRDVLASPSDARLLLQKLPATWLASALDDVIARLSRADWRDREDGAPGGGEGPVQAAQPWHAQGKKKQMRHPCMQHQCHCCDEGVLLAPGQPQAFPSRFTSAPMSEGPRSRSIHRISASFCCQAVCVCGTLQGLAEAGPVSVQAVAKLALHGLGVHQLPPSTSPTVPADVASVVQQLGSTWCPWQSRPAGSYCGCVLRCGLKAGLRYRHGHGRAAAADGWQGSSSWGMVDLAATVGQQQLRD